MQVCIYIERRAAECSRPAGAEVAIFLAPAESRSAVETKRAARLCSAAQVNPCAQALAYLFSSSSLKWQLYVRGRRLRSLCVCVYRVCLRLSYGAARGGKGAGGIVRGAGV